MAQLLTLANRYRFVAVAVIVAGIFSAKSMFTLENDLTIQSAPQQITAGTYALVTVKGDDNEKIKFILEDAEKKQTELDAKTDDTGTAEIKIPQESTQKVGKYELKISYKNSKTYIEDSIEVIPAEPSTLNSKIAFSQTTLRPDQTAIMSVKLEDAFKNPVIGHTLSVSSNSQNVEVYSSEFVTNDQGQMNFYINGNGNEIVNFNIFDSTLGKTILGSPSLALKGGKEAYGTNQIILASSGEVSSLLIDGLSNETLIGETQTITVKAVDQEGATVTDYTGTIRFSSTDASATLPNDYTFLAEDQGEHSFSLAVKFVTPSEQTITVTDLNDTVITGETSTKVVTDISGTEDFNSEFETTDFTRTGDFDLISPASGAYSSNTIEVQGEAEYGYTAVVYLNEEEVGKTEVAFDNSFNYTLQDLADGTYSLYVEIVELDESDAITSVIETSSQEDIIVDTKAPEVISIKSDPESGIAVGQEVTITVLSEKNLESIDVVFNEDTYPMEQTSTQGKYQTKIIMPGTEGTYDINVIISDALGNEAEYKKELSLTVGTNADIGSNDTTNQYDQTVTGIESVTGLIATGDTEKVILSWETPKSENQIAFYRVYYGPSEESLYAVSETFDSSTKWMITNLTGNEKYYFAVTAVDIEGIESAKSQTITAIALAKDGNTSTTSHQTQIYNSVKPTANVADHATSTPGTGPSTLLIIILSSFFALGFTLTRKRA